MIEISDEDFEILIGQAMDAIPEMYASKMDNVGIVWAYEPTAVQRKKLKLRCDQTLFGLYEGIPLTKRGSNYSMVLPDKITIFKNPITRHVSDLKDLRIQIGHTLWHEVAHHFGLDHERIHQLDNK